MSHHVLLIGGHGKIAQFLTPLLLQRSWTVTSLIRTQDQVDDIQSLAEGKNLPGQLHVKISSLADITSQQQATDILSDVKPDYVVWSAGAGGKGGPEMTDKVDRDAAIHFINASAATSSITRFLMVSYNGSRHKIAPWWKTEDWDKYTREVNDGVLSRYHKAKIAADEALYKISASSKTLVGINLRPATLTEDPAGPVSLGKNERIMGKVSRESVAKVAAALLAAPDVQNTWLDLDEGSDDIDDAVKKAVADKVNCAEGEPFY